MWPIARMLAAPSVPSLATTSRSTVGEVSFITDVKGPVFVAGALRRVGSRFAHMPTGGFGILIRVMHEIRTRSVLRQQQR
jgi:hypothetical protein